MRASSCPLQLAHICSSRRSLYRTLPSKCTEHNHCFSAQSLNTSSNLSQANY